MSKHAFYIFLAKYGILVARFLKAIFLKEFWILNCIPVHEIKLIS